MLTRRSIGSEARGAYGLLALSLTAAFFAGKWAMNSPDVVAFCGSTAGWLFMFAAINLVPYLAKWAMKQDKVVGLLAIAFDGALSGVALAPLLCYASLKAPGSILMAGAITAAVFVTVSLCVLLSPAGTFSVPVGALFGISVSLVVGILMNGLLLHLAFLHLVLCIGIGIFGTLVLAFATEELIEKNADAVEGALMLFAALFNIFVSVLNILLSSNKSKD